MSKDQQGKKLGLRIIEALDYIAAKVGCYKSILDCSEANEGFYAKCGFVDVGSHTFVLGSDPQTDRVMVAPIPVRQE